MIPKKPDNAMWSDEQWQAIYDGGKDVLVNAGAGSGKTAVLTERILRILKQGVALDRLIVLTFTKAAAAEMKERIRLRLIAEIQAGEENLKGALAEIDRAAIQTFDSFTLGLVRRFHYLLGQSRTVNIGDEVIFSLKKKEIIERVFASLYEEENKEFLALIDLFSMKNDNTVMGYIYNIHEKLELLADKKSYLDAYVDKHYNKEFIDRAVGDYVDVIKVEVSRIQQRLDYLRGCISDDNLSSYTDDLAAMFSGLFAAGTYNELSRYSSLTVPSVPRKADDESEREILKYQKSLLADNYKNVQALLQYRDVGEMHEEIAATKPYAQVIIKIISMVEAELSLFKKQINAFSYSDIAKMAIRIFKENPDITAAFAANTYEILIDEYQDTNDVQEELIALIARDNVYMVGDMKQSIYRFRNANPRIFSDKYRDFKTKDKGIPIDLSKNFRSRPEVIKGLNTIFAQIMSAEIGGVDYEDNHALVFANKSYLKHPLSQDMRPCLLYYDPEPGFSAAETEAFITALDIKQKMADSFMVYDRKLDCLRKASYGDFTILAAEKRHFDLYKKIFEYAQIPLAIHRDEGFVRSTEIAVVKGILSLVYALRKNDGNIFADSLIGVLRSFVLKVPDDVIARIYRGNPLEGLKLHLPAVYRDLYNIAETVEKSTVGDILLEIYDVFSFYENNVSLGDVESRENKLNFLVNKCYELDKIGYDLADVIGYLEAMVEADLDIEFSAPVSLKDDVVNMMTIHKSKGLEFPVCYYVDTECRFKYFDVTSRVLFSPDYGIVLPVFNEGLKDTFYKDIVKQKFMAEEISERIRLLYVAMTRAKEKMIIIVPRLMETYRNEESKVSFADCLNFNSFYDIFSVLKCSLSNISKLVVPTSITAAYRHKPALKNITMTIKTEQIHKIQVKTKMIARDAVSASAPSAGLLTKKTKALMELGTKIHRYLELLDFTAPLSEQIRLIEEEAFVKNKLFCFFENPLFSENKIINVYREYRFSHEEEGIMYNGIIDLILETDDELFIVDYKLADIEKHEYKRQLQIYYNYLSRVSKKPIRAYLYSVLKEELKRVI